MSEISLYTSQTAPIWLEAFKKLDHFEGVYTSKAIYNAFFYDIALNMKERGLAFQNVDLRAPSLSLSSKVIAIFKLDFLKLKHENYTKTLQLSKEDKLETLQNLPKIRLDAIVKAREIFAEDLASRQTRVFIYAITKNLEAQFSRFYSKTFFTRHPNDLKKSALEKCRVQLKKHARDIFALSIIKVRSLRALPDEITFYKSLNCLYVENCNLESLNPAVADLPIAAMDFQGNRLTRLPIELGKLYATLNRVNFEGNPLQEVLETESLERVKDYLKAFDRELHELSFGHGFFQQVLYEYHELSNPADTYFGWSEDHLVDDRKMLRKAIRNVLRMRLLSLSPGEQNKIYRWIWVLNNRNDQGDPAFGFNKCYTIPEITKIAFSLLFHSKQTTWAPSNLCV